MKKNSFQYVTVLVLMLLILTTITLSAQKPTTQSKPKSPPVTTKKPVAKSPTQTTSVSTSTPKKVIPVDSETLLAEISTPSWIDESLTISPDGKHYAYIKKNGDMMCMVIDGKEGKEYEKIISYGNTFSPDSKRFVYQAYTGPKVFVVIDNKEEKQYDNLQMFPRFSPDSKHLVYAAVLDKKSCLVFDGKEGKQYPEITYTCAFSPNSNRFAYYAVTNDDKFILILDGIEQKKFTEASRFIEFSSDSKHVLYAGFDGTISLSFNTDRGASQVRKGNYNLVLDTSVVSKYNYIGYIKFNPTNLEYIFSAKNADNKSYLVNSNSGSTTSKSILNPIYYKLIFDPIYSPDGKEIAYCALKANDQECAVLNGIENKEYEEIDKLTFSPDAKYLAYVVKDKAGKSYVVYNLMEGQLFDWVSGPIFSPDSKSIAYVAKKDKKQTVVINGKEGKYYDKVLTAGDNFLAINSKNNLYYVGMDQNKLYFVEKTMLGDNE